MEDTGRVKVLSTTAMIDDLVGQIGQERVDHIALIQGELDPHSYELVKGDDEKFNFAQLVFYNGLGLEHGASLRYCLEHHAHAAALGNEIQKKMPDAILRVQGEIDPHIWMDISLWREAIDPIVEALSQQDPQGAPFYREKGEALKKKMCTKHEEIKKQFASVPSQKRYLVTSHDAFNYFTRAYLADPQESSWQKRCAAPEGLAPEGQLSVADIQKTIDHLCQYKIYVVFPESNVSKDALKKIASACVQKELIVRISRDALYGDAMGGTDYLGMQEHNSRVLLKAWTEE